MDPASHVRVDSARCSQSTGTGSLIFCNLTMFSAVTVVHRHLSPARGRLLDSLRNVDMIGSGVVEYVDVLENQAKT